MRDRGVMAVACPYCGEIATHLGTCDLSVMRSGKAWMVVAIPGELVTTTASIMASGASPPTPPPGAPPAGGAGGEVSSAEAR